MHLVALPDSLCCPPSADGHRRKLITEAARDLERSKMARFDERSGNLYVTELGRVASHFYIRHDRWDGALMHVYRILSPFAHPARPLRPPNCSCSGGACISSASMYASLPCLPALPAPSINVFNEMLKPHMNEADVLAMIARSSGQQDARAARAPPPHAHPHLQTPFWRHLASCDRPMCGKAHARLPHPPPLLCTRLQSLTTWR